MKTYCIHQMSWQGIELQIWHNPAYCLNVNTQGDDMAHIQVRVTSPLKAALPFSNTGYRSHFTVQAAIDEFGDPVAYVRAWLEHAALDAKWLARPVAHGQLSFL